MRFLFLIFLLPLLLFSEQYSYIDYGDDTGIWTPEYSKKVDRFQQTQIDFLMGRENDFTRQFFFIRDDFINLTDYVMDSSAGSVALSNIDFGNISPGHFSIGFGFGMSEEIKSIYGVAGAFGMKYNFGEFEIGDTKFDFSGTAKGWTSGKHSAAGFGFTLDF